MILPAEIVINHLLDCGHETYSLVPAAPPDQFVRVDAGAPVAETLVSWRTLIIVQCYGEHLEDVLAEIESCYEDLHMIDQRGDVLGWDFETGPTEFPDPDIPNKPRWQFTGYLTQPA